MMKPGVLLVKPHSGLQVHDTNHPDIGLGYLAAALTKIDVGVRVLDLHRDRRWRATLRAALGEAGLVAVGVKLYSKDVPHVGALLRTVRQVRPDLMTLGGGPHPSGDPGRVLDQLPELDYAFRGEAEIGLVRLFRRGIGARDMEASPRNGLTEVPGLVFRENGAVRTNPAEMVKDLDSLGMPAWELLHPERYQGQWISHGDYLPIMTSRGCPRGCTYCAGRAITGGALRYRSLEGVMEEITFLRRRFGVRHFSICDDNFTYRKEYVLRFCERFAALGEGLSWDCAQNAVRLDSLDRELVTMMEESGCKAVTIAAESGSPRILEHMGKGFDVDDVRRAVRLVRRHSTMTLEGYFIVGYPEETREDVKKSIDLACALDLDGADFFVYTPHPGSPLYERLLEEGRLGGVAWDRLLYSRASVATRDMTPGEVESLRSRAYRRFYLRPKMLPRVGRKVARMDRRLLVDLLYKAFSLMTKFPI